MGGGAALGNLCAHATTCAHTWKYWQGQVERLTRSKPGQVTSPPRLTDPQGGKDGLSEARTLVIKP